MSHDGRPPGIIPPQAFAAFWGFLNPFINGESHPPPDENQVPVLSLYAVSPTDNLFSHVYSIGHLRPAVKGIIFRPLRDRELSGAVVKAHAVMPLCYAGETVFYNPNAVTGL